MRTERTDLSAVRKRLEIEVPASDVRQVFDRTLREARREMRVPGFRPGKVPLDVVRLRLGAELPQRVGRRIIEEFTGEALVREGLNPVPDSVTLDSDEGRAGPRPAEEGAPYRFALLLEVMPQIEPKDYVGLAVSKPPVAEVTDEDVQRELERLRTSRTRLVPVEDRPSAAGDVVEVEVEGAELGQPPVLPKSRQRIELGRPDNPPEFNEHLLGRRAGEEFTFEVRFAEDHADEKLRGRVVYFRGRIEGVARIERPALDDAFARAVDPDLEGLDALRRRIREELRSLREEEAERTARRRLLDMLLARHAFEVPERLVDDELRHRLGLIGRDLQARGLNPREMDVDWDKVIEEQRADARRVVREELLLDAIARKEGIEPDRSELDAVVAELARTEKVPPAALARKLKKEGRLEAIAAGLRRRRTLDWLYDKSQIS